MLEGKLGLVAVEDLKQQNLVARGAEVRERRDQILHVAEAVGEDHEQPAPLDAQDEVVKNAGQAGLAAGLGLLEFVENRLQMRHARARRDVAAHLRVERDHADAVALLQHEIRERGSEAGGVVGFGEALAIAAGVGHRAAQVEQQRGAEVSLLLVFADVVAVGLGEDLPVEPADFIALHILPVLRELDAEALVRRLVQPGEKPLDHESRDDLQVRDLLQLGGREEVSDVGHAEKESGGRSQEAGDRRRKGTVWVVMVGCLRSWPDFQNVVRG